MDHHIQQAEHNQELLNILLEMFPDRFNDWKVVLCFYIAIHYLKAFAAYRDKPLGNTHQEINQALGKNANPKLFQIKSIQWSNYYNLYQNSRTARYDGFLNIEDHEAIYKITLEQSLKLLQFFTNYVKAELAKI